MLSLLTSRLKSYLCSCLLIARYAHPVLCISTKTQPNQMGGVVSSDTPETHWYPEHVLNASNKELSYGIIILNRPIEVNADVLIRLWKNAKIRCTVDKGTDRWISFLQKNNLALEEYKPDIITGDFDSVSPDAIPKFRSLGSKIVSTPCQSATDFQKAVLEITMKCEVDYLISVVESNGRLDHCMSNINTMYKHTLPIYLLSRKYINWILRPETKHVIHMSLQFTQGKKKLGLIPLGAPVHNVVTHGLKWNLCNSTLEFGGLISSSNTYEGENVETVTVEMRDGNLLFSVQLPSFK